MQPLRAAVATNGNGNGSAPSTASSTGLPTAAETARTIAEIVREGTLACLCPEGMPVGSPVSFMLDKQGATWVHLSASGPEMAFLKANGSCSLAVQPAVLPARAVGAVTLVGKIDISEDAASPYKLELSKALYFGGLDQAGMQEVAPEAFMAAEPDVLRASATDLVKIWNEERAEDLYRIVSHTLHVPLTQMVYAELVWVDRLGMYVRTEVEGRDPSIVRVPFYRPVLDERDARSVITMAAQIAWEADRAYVPVPMPTPTETAAASNN